MPARGAGADWSVEDLPGGVRLVLAPMPGRSSVAASVLVRVGSRWEARRLAGISHFLEHIVFKGTERFPTSRAVSESIEGIGGVLNASTDKELTTFWAKVPAERVDRALEVLFDLAFAPRIEPLEVERERRVVLEELSMYLDQPGDLVQMVFDDLVWGSHPLARDPAGTRRSLAAIGAAELRAYRSQHYLADRVVVALAGGFKPAALHRLVEQRLRQQPPGRVAADSSGSAGDTPSPLAASALAKVRRRRGEQVHVLAGVRCSSYLAPDRWALDVLNTVLGEGMSSRLFLELREHRALAYDVHSYAARYRDSGAFAIYLATKAGQELQAVKAALAEVRRLVERRLSPAELRRTQTQIEGRLRLQLESTSAVAEFLGHQAALTGTVNSPEEVIAAIRGVTAAQVQELAAGLFRGVGWRLAAVGPGLDQDRLQEAVGVAA